MIIEKSENKATDTKKNHRAVELLQTLRRLGGSARTSQLADTMDVSEETVRRTVKKLSREGLVSRVHGGVFLIDEPAGSSFHQRISEQSRQKQQLGRFVATLVEDGTSLFLDIGSTTIFVAEALRKKVGLMVVTNSLAIAQTLMNHNQNRVFLAGGELLSDAGGAFGAATLKFVSGFHPDLAILSTAAIDANQGFLLADQHEAELMRTFVSHARKSIMVADYSKTAASAPMVSCDPTEIDLFVTDRPPPQALQKAMNEWNIEVLIAPPKPAKKKKKK